MACVTHIFYNYPDKDPQWLTEHKMAMVSNKFLGAVCVFVGFHKHIRQNSSIMTSQIDEYVEELDSAQQAAGGAKDFWMTVRDPPKASFFDRRKKIC
jgi:endoribonuclease Dicer